jgi:hypothetical protein
MVSAPGVVLEIGRGGRSSAEARTLFSVMANSREQDRDHSKRFKRAARGFGGDDTGAAPTMPLKT